MASLHNDTHTHTLMETHHSFAAHGPAEIRENGKAGTRHMKRTEQKDRKRKKKKEKKERHLLKVVFHLTDLMFLP